MAKPLVAIVGRPNVGKSTFFNRIIGKRVAIVEDTPGVTRDRIYGDAEWLDYHFTLIDTGGIEPMKEDIISQQMRRQAELAIETADVIVFLVDGREGLTASDLEVADLLRRSKKPIVLGVNKVDHPKYADAEYEFYELGIGKPVIISSEQGLGLGDLLDEVVRYFPRMGAGENPDVTNVAVVGRPNVGKSSLVNALLGSERTIVSDIPGTTRDSIDSPFRWNGKDYVLVDTAGIRRKRAIEDESIERYSVIRSLGAIRRADVALIVVDAKLGLSEQDVKIAGYVHEEGKAGVLIVNKWDLIEKDTHTMNEFKKKLAADLAFMDYVPMLFISALTGQRVGKVMEYADMAYEQNCRRVSTGTLNDIVAEAVSVTEPPSDRGRRLRIYYATQVSVKPPTFVLFVNDPELMHFSYKRYLENYFRKSFGLDATPMRLIVRAKTKEEQTPR
ncbi:MAG: GTPase Der [Firmicutes bacterium ADurb.Bin248]|nr:MAG: GTPase Der [Firmicutes bacterium ADurb.Bin248]HOF99897.1 ribosome biogenesis GTPase Der [Clostridia bacterium]HPK16927.1 ribosome biogenesis GTPase Der [Clostridia bacterium]